MNFFDRFLHQISPEPNSGCWLWIGGAISAGYGHFLEDGVLIYAHRAAYEDVHGVGSAQGLLVRHRCDNPPCVNPDHLIAGTHKDNWQDAKDRGRLRPVHGSRHPRAIVSEADVAEMRRLSVTIDVAAIARMFNLRYSTAHAIISGDTWRRVGNVQSVRGVFVPETRYAEDSPRAKLTNDQVREIRRRLASGARGIDLAQEFEVSPATISSIKVGRNWGTFS